MVDYACPDNTADWVTEHFPQVRVVRVSGETGFNPARARNLGARAANAPWLAFFDADILWSPELSASVRPLLQPGHFYRAGPTTLQSWGSIICQRQDFESIGGYDEAFIGWGGEDDDLIGRLLMLGRRPAEFPASLIGEVPHDEAARMRFHEVKDRAASRRINNLYLQAKLDMMRLLGRPLALESRQAMFREIRANALRAMASGRTGIAIEVTLPPQQIEPPAIDGMSERWHLRRTINYALDSESSPTSHSWDADRQS